MVANLFTLKSVSVGRAGWIVLALVPCLTSLGFHLVGPTPTPQAGDAHRPALAFDQYAVNLGPIPPMNRVKAWFRFTNLSDRPVKVTKLKPSCGCLKPRLDKRNYAPGETGEFFVQVSTAGEEPGPQEYTITVEYEDPKPQSVVLTFRLELPARQVYISPRAVLVYVFGEKTAEKEIVVSDNRLNPMTVTGVEADAEFLTANVGETQIEDGIQRTPVKLQVAPVPVGRHGGLLKIFTDDPKFRVLRVPVRVDRQPAFQPQRKSGNSDRGDSKREESSAGTKP